MGLRQVEEREKKRRGSVAFFTNHPYREREEGLEGLERSENIHPGGHRGEGEEGGEWRKDHGI